MVAPSRLAGPVGDPRPAAHPGTYAAACTLCPRDSTRRRRGLMSPSAAIRCPPTRNCCTRSQLRPCRPGGRRAVQSLWPSCAKGSLPAPSGSAPYCPIRPVRPRTGSTATWKATAQASAVAGHCGELILHALATRARALTLGPAAGTLGPATAAMHAAWTAQRQAAHAWGPVTTKPPGPGHSPVADDAHDLIVRLGRLAYANSNWSLAWPDRAPPREPADLVPDHRALISVLSAVHHTADVLAGLATADHLSIRIAANGGRLVIPTRLLPERFNVSRAFVPAFREQVSALLGTYQHTVSAALSAVATLDAAAMTLSSPSRVLTTARALSRWHEATGIHGTSHYTAASPAENLPAWQLAFPYKPGTAADIQAVEEAFQARAARPRHQHLGNSQRRH